MYLMVGGEWLTIGYLINYLKTVIEYATGVAETRASLKPIKDCDSDGTLMRHYCRC